MPPLPKLTNAENPAIRAASKGQECSVKIPGICCRDPARTVGAHLRFVLLTGMAQKPDDLFIVDACDCCHDVIDHPSQWRRFGLSHMDIIVALVTTQKRRRDAGLIILKGEPQ